MCEISRIFQAVNYPTRQRHSFINRELPTGCVRRVGGYLDITILMQRRASFVTSLIAGPHLRQSRTALLPRPAPPAARIHRLDRWEQASVGRPSAADRCIGPVLQATRPPQAPIRASSSSRSSRPHRFSTFGSASKASGSVRTTSPIVPVRQIRMWPRPTCRRPNAR
jgi:hypothetical protein